ncbi:hypothetical protein [Novosphingobium sp.]|uniref:hypothetical protein n=1 Tax=Novosphingobium sp. TaxID=1874826 RepID=UPI002632AC61|nr:hypothetical protein [Novosphingobium sp.]
MRFRKWPKPAAYEETSRKRAAFVHKQRREREALPLFADLIGQTQHSVEEEMAQRAVWWPERQQRLRDERAAVWRRARAGLFDFSTDRRQTIRRIWRDCPYPADPYSFADLLHQIRIGKVDPGRPPWTYHARAQARITSSPASFTDAFKRVGQRRIEPAPDLPPVEAPQYCGNLGHGILFLDAVPPVEADGPTTFQVRGVCTDAEIALIGRLAEAERQQPVRVVRVDLPHTRATGFSHRLLILACSATKRRDPGWMPAWDRYDGPLWQTWRSADPGRRLARVGFLSARYGFGAGDRPIGDYDARLTPELAERMIAGGMTTRWPRPPSPRKPDTYGSHPGCEIASLCYHGTRPFTDVALVGGGLYLKVMRAFLDGFREMRCIVPDAQITEINAGMGVMRQRLRIWLEQGRGG